MLDPSRSYMLRCCLMAYYSCYPLWWIIYTNQSVGDSVSYRNCDVACTNLRWLSLLSLVLNLNLLWTSGLLKCIFRSTLLKIKLLRTPLQHWDDTHCRCCILLLQPQTKSISLSPVRPLMLRIAFDQHKRSNVVAVIHWGIWTKDGSKASPCNQQCRVCCCQRKRKNQVAFAVMNVKKDNSMISGAAGKHFIASVAALALSTVYCTVICRTCVVVVLAVNQQRY